MTLAQAIAEIEQYAALGPDWDGEGANPINPKAIETAKRFAERLNFDAGWCSFAPRNCGGIGYEDEHWIIDINSDGTIEGEWCE